MSNTAVVSRMISAAARVTDLAVKVRRRQNSNYEAPDLIVLPYSTEEIARGHSTPGETDRGRTPTTENRSGRSDSGNRRSSTPTMIINYMSTQGDDTFSPDDINDEEIANEDQKETQDSLDIPTSTVCFGTSFAWRDRAADETKEGEYAYCHNVQTKYGCYSNLCQLCLQSERGGNYYNPMAGGLLHVFAKNKAEAIQTLILIFHACDKEFSA